jgi:hypothetical protein
LIDVIGNAFDKCYFFSDFILAKAASQSALVSIKKPFPLQLFCPWHPLIDVWQEDWPLQPLAPSHLILAASAALAVKGAALNNTAAALAIEMDNLSDFCMGTPMNELQRPRVANTM